MTYLLGQSTRLTTPLPGSRIVTMVVAFDNTAPKADEALLATTLAMASSPSLALVAWPDGCKSAKDGSDEVDDKRPRPPRSVARGRLESSTHNGSKAERFREAQSSLAARAAPLPLLDPAPSLDLQDSVRTCWSTPPPDSSSGSPPELLLSLVSPSPSSKAPHLHRSVLSSDPPT